MDIFLCEKKIAMSRTPERELDSDDSEHESSPRKLSERRLTIERQQNASLRRSRSRTREIDKPHGQVSKHCSGSTSKGSLPREAPRFSEDNENERLTRLELLIETLVRTNKSSASEVSTSNAGGDTKKIKILLREDCVPQFDPQISKYSVLKWLYKIEQLGQVHG